MNLLEEELKNTQEKQLKSNRNNFTLLQPTKLLWEGTDTWAAKDLIDTFFKGGSKENDL